jgi:hypothetical protein
MVTLPGLGREDGHLQTAGPAQGENIMALTITHEARPASGTVSAAVIPVELVEALAAEWEYIQANPDNNAVLTADTKEQVAVYALYARAWGNAQTPRLEVRKAAQTKALPLLPVNAVRLSIKLYDETAPRPGRPATKAAK